MLKTELEFCLAKCLTNVGVKPGDPRDAEGRYRFLPLPYDDYIREDTKQAVPWYWGRIHYPQETVNSIKLMPN